MTTIISKQNNIIKYALAIKEKKGVQKYGECLVESEKLVADLLLSRHTVSIILCDEHKTDKYSHILSKFKGKIYLISSDIAKYLADSVTTSGIFAFVKIPEQETLQVNSNFLVLENLQDPSNFGALIRSAKAFGFDNILMVGGVFPYTYKVIRSSMGYVFDVNISNVTLQDIHNLNLPIYTGDMNGENIKNVRRPNGIFGVAIGNEGNGISDELRKISKHIVSIPMNEGVESLNASVSGGIIMFYLNNK